MISASTVMYYLPKLWYEFARKPDEAVYIHHCPHSVPLYHRNYAVSRSLPNELMDHVRHFIDDVATLEAFDKALSIPPCRNIICVRVAEQDLIERRYDVLSFPDIERNKIAYNPTSMIRNKKSCWVLKVSQDNIRMYTLKPYTAGYLYDQQDPIFTDPVTLSQSYITFTLHIAYDPKKMSKLLRINKYAQAAMPPIWARVYKAILKWSRARMDVRLAYIGYEGMGWNRSGRIWIYPSTRCYSPSKYAYSYEEHIKRPCAEWVDHLYALSRFQKEHSAVLNKIYTVGST